MTSLVGEGLWNYRVLFHPDSLCWHHPYCCCCCSHCSLLVWSDGSPV